MLKFTQEKVMDPGMERRVRIVVAITILPTNTPEFGNIERWTVGDTGQILASTWWPVTPSLPLLARRKMSLPLLTNSKLCTRAPMTT